MQRIDRVRQYLPPALAKLVDDRATTTDANGRLDDEVIAVLARERMLAPAIPTAYGGLGRSDTDLALFAAALNTRCTSARSLVTVQSMVAAAINRIGDQQQRDRYLPLLARGERIAGFCLTGTGPGSDAMDLSGAAVDRAAEPWRLSGRRVWVTFGQRADLLLVVAGPSTNPVAALVDVRMWPDAVDRVPRSGQLGLRGCEIADIEFDNVGIDAADVLAASWFAVSHTVQLALDVGRFTVAAGAAGLVVGCLDVVTEHARTRMIGDRRLGSRQLIRGHVADLLAHAETSFGACLRAARAREEQAADAVYLTMMAKLLASRAATAAGATAVQCLGSSGVAEGFVERAYRDAKVLEIIEGATEVTRLALADGHLGLAAASS